MAAARITFLIHLKPSGHYMHHQVRHSAMVISLYSINWLIFMRVRKIAKGGYYLRHVCPSARNNSASNGRIFMKCGIWGFFENISRKFKFHWNRTRIKVTLHEDQYIYVYIYIYIYIISLSS